MAPQVPQDTNLVRQGSPYGTPRRRLYRRIDVRGGLRRPPGVSPRAKDFLPFPLWLNLKDELGYGVGALQQNLGAPPEWEGLWCAALPWDAGKPGSVGGNSQQHPFAFRNFAWQKASAKAPLTVRFRAA